MQVERRHIIYVQGYDPRGLVQYYRMFRTELRKFAALYGVTSKMSRPTPDSTGTTASWTINTQGANWQTTTRYDFLRWEDLIKRDLEWPIWHTVAYAVAIYCRVIFDGTLMKFIKAHWRFAVFMSYPEFVLIIEAALSLLGTLLFEKSLRLSGLPPLISMTAAAVFFITMLGLLLKLLENQTYALYLMSDTIFTWQYAHRQRPEWDERIQKFAHYLIDCVRKSDANEIVIVGHSSGSFLALEILSQALEIDPYLGCYGPQTTLLTLGGNLPIVGFLAASNKFREHLKKIAIEPSIDWIDCQSRKDVMNFYPFDPIIGHGIDVGSARRNPKIIAVRFRDIIAPENYNTFRRQFFRIHFQFVMANEQPNVYDFFMIACGPISLSDRVAHPAASNNVGPTLGAPPIDIAS